MCKSFNDEDRRNGDGEVIFMNMDKSIKKENCGGRRSFNMGGVQKLADRTKLLVKELEGSRMDRRRKARAQRLREEEIRRKWKEGDQSRGDIKNYRVVLKMRGDRGTRGINTETG